MSNRVQNESIIGLWSDFGNYVSFEFYDDDSFRHINKIQEIDGMGTWEIDSDILYLTMPNGSLQAKMKLSGNMLTLDFNRVKYKLIKV